MRIFSVKERIFGSNSYQDVVADGTITKVATYFDPKKGKAGIADNDFRGRLKNKVPEFNREQVIDSHFLTDEAQIQFFDFPKGIKNYSMEEKEAFIKSANKCMAKLINWGREHNVERLSIKASFYGDEYGIKLDQRLLDKIGYGINYGD